MIFPASQPPSGLFSLGNRMCTRSSRSAKRWVRAWMARIVSSGVAGRPESVEGHVDVHLAQLGQVRDLLVGGLGSVGAYPDRQPGADHGVAEREDVRVYERLTAGER